MYFNQFNSYSKVAMNETRTNKEYDKTMQLISNIENCQSISQIKTTLKKELGLTECVNKHSLGTLGYLSTKDSDKYFEVNILYSKEVHVCVLPKQQEKGVL